MTEITFKQSKQIVRNYLRMAYSDNALTEFLDYTRAGKLRFFSCCCLAGFPLRPAGLKPLELDEAMNFHRSGSHYLGSRMDDALIARASDAFNRLGCNDIERRRHIIPIIKAELRRRMRNEIINPDSDVFSAHH